MINEERERAVATDVRSRVIADCATLLPLASSACKAMDEGDEAEVLRLFCGESQKQTLRRLGRLIDDLSLCQTAADLPGPEPEVVELRNASFRVFRRLSARAGNPLNLTKRFRSGAVDFFRMPVRRDSVLLQLVHRSPWRRFAYDLLFAAIKEALAGNYCTGQSTLIRNFFFGLMQSMADGVRRDGHMRQIANFLTVYPVFKGEVDMDYGYNPAVNGVLIRARLLNEMDIDISDWSFEDVTEGKRSFKLTSCTTGEVDGEYKVGKLGHLNGKDLPSTAAPTVRIDKVVSQDGSADNVNLFGGVAHVEGENLALLPGDTVKLRGKLKTSGEDDDHLFDDFAYNAETGKIDLTIGDSELSFVGDRWDSDAGADVVVTSRGGAAESEPQVVTRHVTLHGI